MNKNKEKESYLVLGYDNANKLESSLQWMIGEGLHPLSVNSVFPVRGMPKNSKEHGKIGFWGAVGAVFGFVGAALFQIYIAVFNYPMNYGGKPSFSFLSFFPVLFECTILFSGVFMFVAFLSGIRKRGLSAFGHIPCIYDFQVAFNYSEELHMEIKNSGIYNQLTLI